MGVKYCTLCQRSVVPKRKIGMGTLIAILFTGFGWLLFIPFYKKRCPMCQGDQLIQKRNDGILNTNGHIHNGILNTNGHIHNGILNTNGHIHNGILNTNGHIHNGILNTNSHNNKLDQNVNLSISDELRKLNDLKLSGILTHEEFEFQKRKLLNH